MCNYRCLRVVKDWSTRLLRLSSTTGQLHVEALVAGINPRVQILTGLMSNFIDRSYPQGRKTSWIDFPVIFIQSQLIGSSSTKGQLSRVVHHSSTSVLKTAHRHSETVLPQPCRNSVTQSATIKNCNGNT